jgi:predicted HTH transcriptional regulator
MSGVFNEQMADGNGEKKEYFQIKIASYDSFQAIPRVVDVESNNIRDLIDRTSEKVYQLSREKGGKLPYTVINEIVENLIHADFEEAIISIMPDGNTICVSDQGPGVADKKKALLPGFSSASRDMKKYIRGVGSGMPIANETLQVMGGALTVEDNIKKGSVITLSLHFEADHEKDFASRKEVEKPATLKRPIPEMESVVEEKLESRIDFTSIDENLSPRQRKVFLLIGEMGEAGPSTVAGELKISLSTAYRDLVTLEDEGLLECVEGGKRRLSRKGIKYLSTIL